MSRRTTHEVRKRQVFYIPGYDPIHPRRYRELYRKESAHQAEISGYDIAIRAKTGAGGFGWNVDATIDGVETETQFDVLVWSDIVKDSMSGSILATYGHLVRTAWVYISTGALGRLMQLRKGPVIAALYPVGVLLLQALAAVMLAWGVYASLLWALGFFTSAGLSGQAWLHQVSALGAGLAAGVRLLRWFKAKDNRIFAYYLMHDYAYAASTRGATPPALDARMAEFAEAIRAALTEDYDEVLVVGHSSGAHLGVSIMAELVRTGRVPENGPYLGFLTLGQVVPMVSFLPNAYRLRRDLQFLSARDELAWIDVTAPGDGCAFALCDPVTVTGVAPGNKRWPLVFSAAFTQTLSRETLAKLKRRYFRLHFQYLCAFDRPKDYDYFQITAGPLSLRDRYDGRPPSKSRIDHAVNTYTSVAA